MIIIHRVTSARQEPDSNREPVTTPSELGVKFVKRLNAFMTPCPSLFCLIDHNLTHSPETEGPSLQSSTITHLTLGSPFLIVQGNPLGVTFPNLGSIKIVEEVINSFSQGKRIGETDVDNTQAEQYIEKVFGNPKHLMGVHHIVLNTILSNEEYPRWNSLKGKDLFFQDVIGRFHGLKKLQVIADPPYVHKRSFAFMLVSFSLPTCCHIADRIKLTWRCWLCLLRAYISPKWSKR